MLKNVTINNVGSKVFDLRRFCLDGKSPLPNGQRQVLRGGGCRVNMIS